MDEIYTDRLLQRYRHAQTTVKRGRGREGERKRSEGKRVRERGRGKLQGWRVERKGNPGALMV